MLHKIQYISQGANPQDHLLHIQQALDAGCEWIQLRMKNYDEATVLSVAASVKKHCASYKATFMVNDFITVAKRADADGVHLGLTDTSVLEARTLLGPGKIIGGTANTLEDVRKRITEQCSYIGLGPFRFTTTKEKLSPILGIQGYREIMNALSAEDKRIPIYAIGGITAADVDDIISTGVHGVALSGVITNAPDPHKIVQQLKDSLYAAVTYSR
jgi:thiamine-phosphate pyrophosphorylase